MAAASWSSSSDLALSSDAEIDAAFVRAKEVFATGITKPLSWRIEKLKIVRRMLTTERKLIERAIITDMRRCEFEARLFETDPIIAHVNEAIAQVASATASEHLSVPLALATSSARVDVVPKGAVLIIGAWNYPAQLTIAPMIDAIAAGNTVVVKPSEVSPHSANTIEHMLRTYFTDGSVSVVQAAKEGTTHLLTKRWDHIVYTGNSFVGRIVMKAAAEHLTPVTLELGGKCPAIVDPSASLEIACKRILQARFANAGQTCLAVDYVLVHASLHDKFVEVLKRALTTAYTSTPQACADFGRIINERHTRRIAATIDDAKSKGAEIVAGGDYEVSDCYVSPTIITKAPADCIVQREETFGPVLLVQRVKDTDEAIARVNSGEKPLSLYIFSEDASIIAKIQRETLSGSVAVNDALVQKGVAGAPFGGVGESGMGAYCGVSGIRELSHHRTVFSNPTALDMPIRYPPYSAFSRDLVGSLVGYTRPPLGLNVAVPVGVGVLLLALYLQGYFAGDRLQRIIDAFMP